MKIRIDIADNFIDVWNEEKEIWERYVKIELEEEPQEHKIPEKINDILRVYDLIPPVDENMYKIWKQTIKNHNKINEILDYLKEIK